MSGWVGRRYLSESSMTLVLATVAQVHPDLKEIPIQQRMTAANSPMIISYTHVMRLDCSSQTI